MTDHTYLRRIDDIGRIAIPREIRRELQIAAGDLLQISANGNQIIICKCDKDCANTECCYKTDSRCPAADGCGGFIDVKSFADYASAEAAL